MTPEVQMTAVGPVTPFKPRPGTKKKSTLMRQQAKWLWGWNAKKNLAVVCLVEGKSIPKTAKEVGVRDGTIRNWLKRVEFTHAVEEYKKKWGEIVLNDGLARQEVRIKRANERAEALDQIKEERREHYKKLAAEGKTVPPGAETGYIAEKFTKAGYEAKFDSELFTKECENEKQVAQDLGQFQEKTGANVAIQIVCPQVPVNPDPGVIVELGTPKR